MEQLKIFITLLTFCVVGVLSKELPPIFKDVRCGRSEAELSACVVNIGNGLLSKMKDGLPDYGIPATDPMLIAGFESKADNPKAAFNVNQKYKNLKIFGMSDAIIKKFKGSFAKDKCELKYRTNQPELGIYGDYQINGQALLFKLNGKGKVNITATDVLSNVVIKCEYFTKDNEEYLRFSSLKLNIIDMQNVKMNLENILDGNPELSNSINEVLNENANDVIKEMSGGFTNAFSEVYLEVANKIVDGVPVKDIFKN